MMNVKKKISYKQLAFASKDADIRGGISVDVTELPVKLVMDGTPVGKDNKGLYHVIKTACVKAVATAQATEIQVAKGHQFLTGDHLAKTIGKKSALISVVDSSHADYDRITLSVALNEELAVNDVLVQVSSEAVAALRYPAAGLTGTPFEIDDDQNRSCDCVTAGKVRRKKCAPVHSCIESALTNIEFV